MVACGFHSPDAGPPDTPPVAPEVRFVSVTASEAMLRPGLYGMEITAVLRNELATEITGIRASLTFRDGTGDRRAAFRWRDFDARDGVTAPQPASIPPGAEATFRFRVDALAHAVGPGPILLDGEATFQVGGSTRAAAPLDPPASLPFAAGGAPIVVTVAADEDNAGANLSFREAVKLANANPGFDRIVFSPAVFPVGSPTNVVLSTPLGELPPVNGDLVIDGRGANVVLTVDASWRGTQRYGLRLQGGVVVIQGISFRDLGEGYPVEDVSTSNCGAGAPREGGAIRVDGGTLILDGIHFADPSVSERNCYAASLRLEGGSGHRILNNTWTDQAMDSMFINAATLEVSGNTMDASPNLGKADDCIVIQSESGADLWIVGNLCADPEYSGILASGTDAGKLYVVNNTFVRSHNGSGVVRGNGRQTELHNNVYSANQPAAIAPDAGGSNLVISYEATFGNGMFCNLGCLSATIVISTISSSTDLGVMSSAGITRADFTPRSTSPLVDSGFDLVDRNGSAPGRFNGAGPERGAVELP
jgi:hypothetical protein